MSLVNAMMVDCQLYDLISTPDGEGGFNRVWTKGAKFRAAVIKDNSLTARVAEKSGVTEIYTITTTKDVVLRYGDAFKRLSDGATFRVTSNVVDSQTPSVASFEFGQVSAERWELVT